MKAVGAAIGCILFGFAAIAEDVEGWVKLDGAAIEVALDARTLRYGWPERDDGAVQTFYKSGKTMYDAGHPSWGSWRIQGDAYCSEWPPNAGWDCYDLEQRVDPVSGLIEMRFISSTGHISRAIYME